MAVETVKELIDLLGKFPPDSNLSIGVHDTFCRLGDMAEISHITAHGNLTVIHIPIPALIKNPILGRTQIL